MSAVTVVSPRMGSQGWPFAQVDSFPGADEDPLYRSEHVKDLYLKANPDYGGRFVLRAETSWIDINSLAQVYRPRLVGQKITDDREQ